jgi:hypothetical protein
MYLTPFFLPNKMIINKNEPMYLTPFFLPNKMIINKNDE